MTTRTKFWRVRTVSGRLFDVTAPSRLFARWNSFAARGGEAILSIWRLPDPGTRTTRTTTPNTNTHDHP